MQNVWQLYEKHWSAFDRDRSAGGEEKYLRLLASGLSDQARILDLGCGGGEPVTRFFIERGFRVTGIDASPSMIRLCRARFPTEEWIVSDMRALALGRRFEAVIAWDSFFHLPRPDQRMMFPLFREHLLEDGLLLFTSGPSDGEVAGSLYGDPLYHASLDPDDYEHLLCDTGFVVLRHVLEDPHCGGHTVWVARAREMAQR